MGEKRQPQKMLRPTIQPPGIVQTEGLPGAPIRTHIYRFVQLILILFEIKYTISA